MISILTTILLSQCASGITDNAQELCGLKTLPQGAVVGENAGSYESILRVKGSGIVVDGPYAKIEAGGDAEMLYFRDNRPWDSLSPSFRMQTRNYRLFGNLWDLWNYNTELMALSPFGDLSLIGTITDRSGISSHVSLTTTPGYNVVIQGRAGEQRQRYRSECFDGGSNPDGGYTATNRPTTGAWKQIALTEEWLTRVLSLEARLADAGL